MACGNTGCGLCGVKVGTKSTSSQVMEEILHHVGCIKPSKLWDELPVDWLAGFLNHQQYNNITNSIALNIFGSGSTFLRHRNLR